MVNMAVEHVLLLACLTATLKSKTVIKINSLVSRCVICGAWYNSLSWAAPAHATTSSGTMPLSRALYCLPAISMLLTRKQSSCLWNSLSLVSSSWLGCGNGCARARALCRHRAYAAPAATSAMHATAPHAPPTISCWMEK